MNGTFAIFGSEVYFSDTLIKRDFSPMRYPLENWLEKDGYIFVPLCRDSIGTAATADRVLGEPYHSNCSIPETCGVSFNANHTMLELGTEGGKFVWRRVPCGPGVVYVISSSLTYTEVLYASLMITKDLRQAVELASKSTMSLSVDPIFTTVPIASYAARMRNPGLIRTMTTEKLQVILEKELKNKK